MIAWYICCWLGVLKKEIIPCYGGDKGGRAADKRCVVAAVEIWTTILIVIGCRPTFPVGTIMAIACAVSVQRERRVVRVERSQPCADCCGSPYLAPSRWKVSVQEPQWRQPYMNKQSWLCESIIGSLVSGQLLHTARCSTVLLTRRHFLLKVAHTHKTTSEKLWSRVALTCTFAIFQRMIWIRKHPLQQLDNAHNTTSCQFSYWSYFGFLG